LSQQVQAAFLVLSDLHFGAGLREGAEVPPLDTRNSLLERALRLLNLDVRRTIERFIEEKCVAHDIQAVKELPRYLKQLLQKMRSEGYESKEFDAYVLLGDLATWPSPGSYAFLRSYLTERRISAGDREYQVKWAGLGIHADQLRQRLVVIPGNHDKLLLTGLDLYHRHFLEPLGLPPQPEAAGCYLLSRAVESREFLFILIDGSRYAAREMQVDASVRRHLACGEVTGVLHNEIFRRLDRLQRGESVDGAQIQDFARATKILVVHYAVDLSLFPGLKTESLILPHECEALARLVSDLRTKVQLSLVLHGHLHIPKIYSAGVPVIAASTTTQKGGYNGFFVLKFLNTGEMRAEHHRWFGTGYLPDPDASLTRTIALDKSAAVDMPIAQAAAHPHGA